MGRIGRVVVVGAGLSGVQACVSLRDNGFTGALSLIGAEPGLPYERPALSKAYLRGETDIALRSQAFYESKSIELINDRVTRIDRAGKVVRLETGPPIGYDRLILATGARPRTLSMPGARLSNVLTLRARADADAIRDRLVPGRHVVIVGGGFIGLELASVARELGCHTTVVESLPYTMSRVVSAATSIRLTAAHRRMLTTVRLGRQVTGFEGDTSGAVRAVLLDDGRRLSADTVIVGIGVVPNEDLASDSGLSTSDGILVDEYLRTSDPSIHAIGDCARFPSVHAGGLIRLESVQNASDQARCVAATLTGDPAPYIAVPSFWSDQCGLRLQIAGLAGHHDQTLVKDYPAGGGFSVFCFHSGRLVAVESVNRPADHAIARKLLAAGAEVTPADVARPDFDLKTRNHQPA